MTIEEKKTIRTKQFMFTKGLNYKNINHIKLIEKFVHLIELSEQLNIDIFKATNGANSKAVAVSMYKIKK